MSDEAALSRNVVSHDIAANLQSPLMTSGSECELPMEQHADPLLLLSIPATPETVRDEPVSDLAATVGCTRSSATRPQAEMRSSRVANVNQWLQLSMVAPPIGASHEAIDACSSPRPPASSIFPVSILSGKEGKSDGIRRTVSLNACSSSDSRSVSTRFGSGSNAPERRTHTLWSSHMPVHRSSNRKCNIQNVTLSSVGGHSSVASSLARTLRSYRATTDDLSSSVGPLSTTMNSVTTSATTDKHQWKGSSLVSRFNAMNESINTVEVNCALESSQITDGLDGSTACIAPTTDGNSTSEATGEEVASVSSSPMRNDAKCHSMLIEFVNQHREEAPRGSGSVASAQPPELTVSSLLSAPQLGSTIHVSDSTRSTINATREGSFAGNPCATSSTVRAMPTEAMRSSPDSPTSTREEGTLCSSACSTNERSLRAQLCNSGACLVSPGESPTGGATMTPEEEPADDVDGEEREDEQGEEEAAAAMTDESEDDETCDSSGVAAASTLAELAALFRQGAAVSSEKIRFESVPRVVSFSDAVTMSATPPPSPPLSSKDGSLNQLNSTTEFRMPLWSGGSREVSQDARHGGAAASSASSSSPATERPLKSHRRHFSPVIPDMDGSGSGPHAPSIFVTPSSFRAKPLGRHSRTASNVSFSLRRTPPMMQRVESIGDVRTVPASQSRMTSLARHVCWGESNAADDESEEHPFSLDRQPRSGTQPIAKSVRNAQECDSFNENRTFVSSLTPRSSRTILQSDSSSNASYLGTLSTMSTIGRTMQTPTDQGVSANTFNGNTTENVFHALPSTTSHTRHSSVLSESFALNESTVSDQTIIVRGVSPEMMSTAHSLDHSTVAGNLRQTWSSDCVSVASAYAGDNIHPRHHDGCACEQCQSSLEPASRCNAGCTHHMRHCVSCCSPTGSAAAPAKEEERCVADKSAGTRQVLGDSLRAVERGTSLKRFATDDYRLAVEFARRTRRPTSIRELLARGFNSWDDEEEDDLDDATPCESESDFEEMEVQS